MHRIVTMLVHCGADIGTIFCQLVIFCTATVLVRWVPGPLALAIIVLDHM